MTLSQIHRGEKTTPEAAFEVFSGFLIIHWFFHGDKVCIWWKM
jgi:hypothetical protein